jgi:agmatine deiminase
MSRQTTITDIAARLRQGKRPTPAALGFRMPAEWEPQDAIWLSWPHKRASWPGQFRPIPGVFAGIVAQISRFQRVRINCAAALQPRAKTLCARACAGLARAGADFARVTFHNHPTNDAWCRDHGPIFVKNDRTGEVAVTDWVHNSWGNKYPPHDLDNTIPPKIARALRLRRFVKNIVLEGGSIEVNGAGDLLTTEQCLLNKNRNPRLTRAQIEQTLRDYLGVTRVHWLAEGILGDDTDGHIDDLTRFHRPDALITAVEPNRRDPNHPILAANLARLRALRTPAGRPFEITELPLPRPFAFRGQRVPASYANFLIINNAVLVPNFRQPRRDAAANATLATCFPGRKIIPIDCYHLIWGLGTLHCISQQQPA